MRSAALDMRSPVWFLLVPVTMWAPALARFVVLRTVDRHFRATLPLQHFAGVGGHATVVALALPIVVYGTAYGIAWIAGWVYWSPGGGLWTTNSRIALNVLVNVRWGRDVARGRRRATALLLRRRGDWSSNRRPEAGRPLTRVVTRRIEIE
jgi:hypothetical protein